jgi:glycerol-3-phosphate dehydrogenase
MPSYHFDRDSLKKHLSSQVEWDMIIIGGGATGLGIALDSASRGYATLLLEQSDFAKGTSSRSTKLVHGGVRYLAQGDIRLVYNALHERGLLLKNAAHLVKRQAFVIPCYSWFAKMKYLIGLKLYDMLSGRFSFGKSQLLSRKEVVDRFPAIKTKGLVGGIEYYDGQFDDARLAINLAQTAAEKGAVVLNYFKVTGLLKENNIVSGVQATDLESHTPYKLKAKTVINATGVFVDEVLQMDSPGRKPLVRPSQGVHLVFHRSFLNAGDALMIPKTADGRVLFAVPWHDHVLVGTTDTPLNKHSMEPLALEEEINFIINTIKQYTTLTPTRKDVLSVFAGLRPLAAPDKKTRNTKEISRDHKLIISDSGLITITGGKWTTYRKMAEETVDFAISKSTLKAASSQTEEISIHGSAGSVASDHELSVYGSDREKIETLIRANPALDSKLSVKHPYTEAEVIWAVRNEMARSVEDVLARRLRLLFLDAREAIAAAPTVAALIAAELGYSKEWQLQQVQAFTSLAGGYLLVPYESKIDQPTGIPNELIY